MDDGRRRKQNLDDATAHAPTRRICGGRERPGVVGIAQRAKIMTVKVLDPQLAGHTTAVRRRLRYAAANGARIIN